MNFRFTAILFGLVLLVGVALLIRALWPNEEETSLIPTLAGVKADQIDVVEIERTDPNGKLKFERKGKDTWEITEPIHAKADSHLVESVINTVLKVKPTTFTEHVQLPNPSVAELHPPSLKVILREGTERSGLLNIGKVSYGPSNSSVFVSTEEHPDRVIPVSRGELDPLFRAALVSGGGRAGDLAKWTNDYRVKDVFPTMPHGIGEDVTVLKLSLPNKKKELALSRTATGWKFDVPAGWGEADISGDMATTETSAKFFTGVRPMLTALHQHQSPQCRRLRGQPQGPERVRSQPGQPRFNPRGDADERRGLGGRVYREKGRSRASAPPAMAVASGKVWVRIEGQPGVIRANTGDLTGLTADIENPEPLRDHTLLAIERSRIDGLDLTDGEQTTKLRKVGAIPEWKLYGNPSAGDPQAANVLAVNKLLELLMERRTIKSFPPANPANFPMDPKAKKEIKIWTDGFETSTDPKADPKAEPKEKGKPTILLFGKKEGDSIYVRRTLPDGTSNEFTVPDKIKVNGMEPGVEMLPALSKTRLDFLDKGLKTFGLDAITRVTVTGVKNYEVEKEEKKGPGGSDRWVIVAPADQKGKVADTRTVEEMLRLLGTTHSVTRYVDETPTPAKLAEFGLGPPAMPAPKLKIVVSLKGTDAADKERVYEFGSTVGDNVYARTPAKPAVFEFRKFVYESIANADLRDKAIFSYDPAQITSVELKGWKSLFGTPTTYAFEKNKDGVWQATMPKEWPVLDPKKVDDFLATLKAINVKNFLPGAPTPEQGLDVNQDALEITLKTGTNVVVTVKLGALTDGNTAYFATASILPPTAPVFTIDSDKLKPYKEKPAAFAK